MEERGPRGGDWKLSLWSLAHSVDQLLENPLVVIYLLSTALSRTMQRYQDATDTFDL